MNKVSVTLVAAVILALLTITLSALAALKVFAAESGQTTNQTQTQPAPGIKTPNAAKWNYRILRSQDTPSLEHAANRLAEEGFELFAFEIVPAFLDQYSVNNSPQFVMVLRRAKP